jgi:outer membrane protein TolC
VIGVSLARPSTDGTPAESGSGASEPLPLPPASAGRDSNGSANAAAQPDGAPSSAGTTTNALPGSVTDHLALPSIESSGDWQVTLPVVIDSIQRSYPLLRIALLQGAIADGDNLSAQGEFDLSLKGETLNQPQGFYKNYRHKVSLTQPVFQGGYVMGNYRLGDGFFPTWYGERVTNEGGEFALGVGGPLLKGREIDERRTKLFQSQLAQSAVEPNVQAQMLDFVRLGTQYYWTWVAAGQAVEAYRELLRLAEQRVVQIKQRVEAGDLERIARINNEQLIASRETKLIEAERKVQMSAIKLSLFLRNPVGEPLVASNRQLPRTFPPRWNPSEEQIQLDVATALAARPEFIELNLVAEQTRIELAYAENSLLPKVDWVVYTSKDVGGPASSKNDKTPFEMEAGIVGEVPLQRRQARGKIESLRGKLSQIQVKREFLTNKVTAEVQDAVSALRAAAARIERAEANVRLATEARELARAQFDVGDIDLVELNIYEQAVTDAQFQRIAAEADFFISEADYRAALAIDPRTASPTD